MKARLLFALTLILAPAVGITPAFALSPKCDQCADLPELYRELMEQEFLREWFASQARQGGPFATVGGMERAAAREVGEYGRRRNSTPVPGGQSTPSRAYGGAYGTDPNAASCDLVEIVSKNNPDGTVTTENKKTTPDAVHKKHCQPIADYILKHEGRHNAACVKQWKDGKQAMLDNPGWVAQDEADAYMEGVKSLREYIAALSLKCQWPDSYRKHREDGRRVVPTPEQIEQLQHNSKSKTKALKRGTK